MVTIYTTATCPRCRILKEKMDTKGIEYQESSNIDLLLEKGIQSVPVLEVEGELFSFKDANDWINDYVKGE